jgi:glycosyltransferase involved in cell wall biosynthesis
VAERETFSYPARRLDRLLGIAGRLERAVRALPRLRPALLRQWRHGRRAARPTRQAIVPSTAASGSPILYLPAVAWHYRFQRPQQLALALARAGHPVLYVDGFLRSRLLPDRAVLESHGDLRVLRVRVPGRPDPYREILGEEAASQLAGVLLAGLGGRKPAMILVQLPFWAALGRELARRTGAPLVYDRIDLHTGFPGVPAALAATEEALMREADLVVATAGLLAEEPRRLGARVLLLPNAVELAAFSPGKRDARDSDDGLGFTVGYVGALGPWFDAGALWAAAEAHPAWRFRLAGRIESPEVEELGRLPNVETLGEIPFSEVPGFLAGLDVALVPFRDLPLTRAVDPVKLYEALAMGLPVVARRLPETARWREPAVFLYGSEKEFIAQVERALAARGPAAAAERRALAEGETWDERAGELLAGCPATHAAGSAGILPASNQFLN